MMLDDAFSTTSIRGLAYDDITAIVPPSLKDRLIGRATSTTSGGRRRSAKASSATCLCWGRKWQISFKFETGQIDAAQLFFRPYASPQVTGEMWPARDYALYAKLPLAAPPVAFMFTSKEEPSQPIRFQIWVQPEFLQTPAGAPLRNELLTAKLKGRRPGVRGDTIWPAFLSGPV